MNFLDVNSPNTSAKNTLAMHILLKTEMPWHWLTTPAERPLILKVLWYPLELYGRTISLRWTWLVKSTWSAAIMLFLCCLWHTCMACHLSLSLNSYMAVTCSILHAFLHPKLYWKPSLKLSPLLLFQYPWLSRKSSRRMCCLSCKHLAWKCCSNFLTSAVVFSIKSANTW